MPEDRSLDDFADADAAADADAGTDSDAAADADATADSVAADSADSDGGAADSADAEGDATEAADPDDADPAVATSTWHADGAECERCGERVERRWREADAFVCADCASW